MRWPRQATATRRRKARRGMFAPTGRAPSGTGRGYDTGNAYADALRNSGIVRDLDVPSILLHKRRMRQRRRFGIGKVFDALRSRGVPIYDETAAQADKDGYTWSGDA